MHTRRLVLTLQFAMGVLAAGYGVMFTMLDDWRREYGIQETGLSMIIAIGFFTSFVAQLTIAPLADKGHARKLLSLGMLANAVGAVMMAFGESLPAFLLGRFVMGLGAGIAIPAIKRIVIVSDPENIGRNLGRGVSIEVAGFAIGPVISALTVDAFNLAAPFIIITALTMVFGVIISQLNISETAVEDRTDERFALDLLKLRPVLGSILVGLALYVMIGVYDSLWVIMMDDLQAPNWVGNAGVALFGLPWIFFGTLGGKIAQRHGPLRVSAFGLAMGALHMTSYGFLSMPYLMLGIGLSQSILDSLTVTGTGIAVAQATPPERQAGASGLLGGMQTLTGGVSAVAAGVLYEHFGQAFAFSATGIVMALLVTVGCVLAGKQWLRKPSPELALLGRAREHST
ncbi:MAG: MFS transporter [Actinomycetota bacterium]|nr:MFS transporter [Actinomycetota bacterium]